MRGLKLFKDIGVYAIDPESHPTWVRGLKYLHISGLDGIAVSHPTWVRGLLNLLVEVQHVEGPKSHPTWVRGLK